MNRERELLRLVCIALEVHQCCVCDELISDIRAELEKPPTGIDLLLERIHFLEWQADPNRSATYKPLTAP